MASYCICIKCHRTWIVSKLDPPPKSNYICPACSGDYSEGGNIEDGASVYLKEGTVRL